jgi:arylsulfatase A-like enzyme
VITNRHMPFPEMFTIAHALQPMGYRRFNLGHMHWTDPSVDTGYEPWITHQSWRDAMPDDVLRRYDWESQSITRRTTGGPGPRTRAQYSGYFVAQNAIRQIQEAVCKDEPFLCWAAFSEPHPPFYPPRELYAAIDQAQVALPAQPPEGSGKPHERILHMQEEWAHLTETEVRQILAGYYGMVSLVDEYCGLVLDALDRLGIADNTIVIWTSDHGDQMWEHDMFLKFCMYEGSVHVPLLVRIPGREPGVRNELVEHIDLFPTICHLLGAETPATVQGRSLVPLLNGGSAADDWRDAVFSQIGDVLMIRTKEWKLNTYGGSPGELYDLRRDPQEFHNLIADGDHGRTVETLHARLQEWQVANAPSRAIIEQSGRT